MRILQLRFKNLNSLVGEWQIDLTHSDYIADGIFAITGPTGAGKSTILDALCLALYGRTPRLRTISKSSNEIMSRQTGECFAEVIFETNAGQYRCHWSQHRARKKAEGELQSPKHEIADVISGKILKANIRGVAEQIEQITGMDFDRFTRSMLLAQGGFAAFLQADADQRAPILEQITGTEIYSHISIKVHELRVAENKKLELLTAELAGMQLLSEQDEQQFRELLTEKTAITTGLTKQLNQKTQAIKWLEGIERNKAELLNFNEQQQNLNVRQLAFQPEQHKLQLATRAAELSADYAALNVMRNEQQRSQQKHTENQQVLPELNEHYLLATKSLDAAITSLVEVKNNQKLSQVTIRKVRELDLKIQEKQTPIKTTQDAKSNLVQQLERVKTQQDEANSQLKMNEIKRVELTDLLDLHKNDEGLIAQLESIQNQFKALADLAHQQQKKKNELVDAQSKKLETAKAWHTKADLLKTQQQEFELINKKLLHYQHDKNQYLNNQTLNELRQDLAKFTQQKTLLEQTELSIKSSDNFKREFNQFVEQLTKLSAAEENLNRDLQQKIITTNALEREVELLETQLHLQQKIQSYEQERQHLNDGTPCPLCGSAQHPYAQGNIPILDDTLNNLNQKKQVFKQSSDELTNLKIKLADNLKDQQQNKLRQQEFTNKIEQEQTKLSHFIGLLVTQGLNIKDEITASSLIQQQQENEKKLKQLTKIVTEVERVELHITSEQTALDKKRGEVTAVEQQVQLVNNQQLLAEQAFERLTAELDSVKSQQTLQHSSTLDNVANYGIEELAIETLDQTLQQLTLRRDQWRTWQQDKSIIEPLIANLQNQIKYQSQQIAAAESELKNHQNSLEQLVKESAELKQQRHIIFADKDPDNEEAQLINTIDKAEQDIEIKRKLAKETEQILNKCKHDIETLTQEIASRNSQLTKAETDFKQRLFETEFNDEDNYKAACLSPEQYKILQESAQQLQNEHNALKTRIEDKTTQLAQEQQKHLTEQSLDELKEIFEKLNLELTSLQQDIGGIRQKLNDNDDIRLKQKTRLQQIENQQKECVRWNNLHELIGSADGKKYRNFAQGLTFEMMIGHANRQLQKMTDRYLLIRDEAQPLELNVVDSYQAGETRSTKNLSGGESFIVSLALALGLSQMASKNVRVDSLFLDEGFGTLDEEALDTALETLAGLQQEGKLIGVISHVQLLKERIKTQIQISPNSGGHSTLSGPGITSGTAISSPR